MKKLILAVALLMLTGCNNDKVKEERTCASSRFTLVESVGLWYVVYDTETKVMYAVSSGGYNGGNFTVLVNSDGKPLLWEGTTE